MKRDTAIGIDLGTTYSAVAWVDESGHSSMLPNAEGDLLTPSVVLFSENEVVVGKEARSANTVHPDWVAQWVKRDMGAAVFGRPIRGKFLPPEVIQACILRKLRHEVVDRLGPDARVVITVPAYFDEPRRKATADAGTMAGLNVLDVVNEPTAAALAFYEAFGYPDPSTGPKEPMTVLVYDLGGGTFDATLLRMTAGEVHTLATDGDVQLGGYDWDWRLADHVADAFEVTHGIDLRRDPVGLSRLLNAVTEAKHTLSVRGRAAIRIEHLDRSLDLEVAREQFERLTADLLERTAFTVRQLLRDAGLLWKDVSRLLLVGGATRMPMVVEMLEELTRLTADRSVAPDEAVARGAALYASHLLAQGSGTSRFQISNVNSHSLGVEGIDRDTLRKTNVVLIKRNTPLPARFTETFTTKTEGQRSIAVQVIEGESPVPEECAPIGRTVIRDLPDGLPKGWPIEVTFEYAANGRLSVRAVVPGTGREVGVDFERSVGLSANGLDRWASAVDSSEGFEPFESLAFEPTDAPGAYDDFARDGNHSMEPPAVGSFPAASTATPAEGSAAASTAPQPEESASRPEDTLPGDSAAAPPVARSSHSLRWFLLVLGYLSSALVGLGLGWLFLGYLSRRWPDVFHLPW